MGAGWLRRAFACLVDVGLLSGAFALTEALFGRASVPAQATQAGVVIGYFGWGVGVRGQTAGKLLLGLEVIDADTGGRIGVGRALLRMLTTLALFPFFVDLLYPLWDPRRQAIHDRAVRSLVVVAGRVRSPDGEAEVQPDLPPGERLACERDVNRAMVCAFFGFVLNFFLLGPVLGLAAVFFAWGARLSMGDAPEAIARRIRRQTSVAFVIAAIDVVIGITWWSIVNDPNFSM